MRFDVQPGVTVFLNGSPLNDCVWADVQAGEVCVFERHWSTNELVREPDGQLRTMILKGRVTMEKPLVSAPSASPRRDPCYVCGGDCPEGCCQMCCFSDPLTRTIRHTNQIYTYLQYVNRVHYIDRCRTCNPLGDGQCRGHTLSEVV